MEAHAPPKPASSGGTSTFDKTKGLGNRIQKWGVRALLAGILLLVILGGFSTCQKMSDMDKARHRVERASVSSPSVSVTKRTIKSGVICSPWTFERQQCTFDHVPTEGFGIAVAGAEAFCFDQMSGSSSSFRIQRLDDSGTFVDFNPAGTSTVNTMRLVGNREGATVTVSYWLAGAEGCGGG